MGFRLLALPRELQDMIIDYARPRIVRSSPYPEYAGGSLERGKGYLALGIVGIRPKKLLWRHLCQLSTWQIYVTETDIWVMDEAIFGVDTGYYEIPLVLPNALGKVRHVSIVIDFPRGYAVQSFAIKILNTLRDMLQTMPQVERLEICINNLYHWRRLSTLNYRTILHHSFNTLNGMKVHFRGMALWGFQDGQEQEVWRDVLLPLRKSIEEA